jgi:hypothetical protein
MREKPRWDHRGFFFRGLRRCIVVVKEEIAGRGLEQGNWEDG